MKTITVYKWEHEDPSLTFVLEAANRLANFQLMTTDEVELRSLNRLLGLEFEESTVQTVARYLRTLATRARDKWAAIGNLPSPTENDLLIRDSIFQAADNAEQAAVDLVEIFNQAR